MGRILRKLLKYGFFGLVVLVTLLALAWAVENWRGYHAWNKYRRAMEARGEVFEMAKLVPPEVPDDKNFAMMPLLKPLFEYTFQSNFFVWLDTNGLQRLENTGAELYVPERTNRLDWGSVDKGTFADLAVCADYYRGNTNFPQVTDAHATAAEVILTALSRFKPEIGELKEAARTRPYSRFPVHYTEEPYWNILLRHLAHIKGLTQLFQLRAIAELESGDSVAAFEDLKLALRIGDALHDEPLLISQLVRIAASAINIQTVREGMVRHRWTDAQLKELQTYYSQANFLHDYETTMRGERAFCLGGIDYMRRAGWHSTQMQIADTKNGEMVQTGPLWLLPSGWCYQNMLNICHFDEQFGLPAIDEKARLVHPEITAADNQWVKNMRRGPYNIFVILLAPALDKAALRFAHAQTRADQARLACALERYRLAKGSLPETLAALAPDFLENIPADVFDGKPLRYHLEQDGHYILYCIGWNEKDDNGKLAWRKASGGNTEILDPNAGDWVWSMPAELPKKIAAQ